MATRTESWFRGHTAWYVRAVVWFLQTLAVGSVLRGLFGTDELLAFGFVGALFLFGQVEMQIRQEVRN